MRTNSPVPPPRTGTRCPCPGPVKRRPAGFSLTEVLVSSAVLSLILLMVVQVLDSTQRTWESGKARIAQFRDARIAFDTISRNLSQSTLNTYLDYFDRNGERILPGVGRTSGSAIPVEPAYYDRYSELHFLVDHASAAFGESFPGTTHTLFFQAPLGDAKRPEYRTLGNLLNGRGYYVAYVSDEYQQPAFLRSRGNFLPKHRWRLMEYRPPSEMNRIYETPDNRRDWIGQDPDEVIRNSRVIADNVIALIVSPLTSAEEDDPNRFDIAPGYVYDSSPSQNGSSGTEAERQRHQLPPLIKVTLVAIDEESSLRLGLDENTAPDLLVSSQLFQNAARFEQDLEQLGESLSSNAIPITYRVFSGVVSVRGSKWSDESFISVPGTSN